MEGDDPPRGQRTQQCRHVAVANDRLRVVAQPVEIERRHEALGPVAAARAEDGPDLGVRQHGREVARTRRIGKALAYDCVFLTHQLKQLEYKGERLLTEIFRIFAGQYLEIPKPRFNLLPPDVAELLAVEPTPTGKARRLCDYLAGMTDGFATRTCKRLTDPDFGSIVDLV